MYESFEEAHDCLTLRRNRRAIAKDFALTTGLYLLGVMIGLAFIPFLKWASRWVDSIQLLGFLLVPAFVGGSAVAWLESLGILPYVWRAPNLRFDRRANELHDGRHALCPLFIRRNDQVTFPDGETRWVEIQAAPVILIRKPRDSKGPCTVEFTVGDYAPVRLGRFDEYSAAYEVASKVGAFTGGQVFAGILGAPALPP